MYKVSIKELELKINKLRRCMVFTAQLKGTNHSDTIKQSQELDQLLNDYQKNIPLMPAAIENGSRRVLLKNN
ncbi:hypothetical protein BKP35_09045 [Anaerobacillus arseniciselenatis]|uniref:Spo0E family sporulation regulatory protein-aspartic acid phosphatase n=1 Tax=Anaerobacillus arseniciselenatis TaxID=85682 RepID=A0A1S2LLN4_9BACI|nr:aspartyl-phosphate phosphatase Spo0E family protein [Anaerobacillus arseniciselenatis]OIJ13371.1 hypothetical protein BKP35_09045 [Anaerobacillus arseniciselenatis]